MFHEDLFDCLSADIKGAISKEMIKDNVMVRAEDGGYLILPMKILKKYIEQELEARMLVNKRFSLSRDTGRNYLPPFSQRHVPYAPAQNIPKPYVKSYYCLEEGQSFNRCNYLFEDQNKKWVSRQGGGFLFPNWQRVPTDRKISPKKLVEDFGKEQEELTKIRKENEAKESALQPKEANIIQAKKNDISTAIAKIEDWGSWQPPTISSANDPFLNNYGLRKTKQRSSRNVHPSQESAKALPKKMETPRKKKPNIPQAYIEDEQGTVEKTIIPTKFKKLQELREEEGVIPEVKEKQDSGKKQ
ncbi:hypothetical protein O181_064817 [Austropuccinia psidii MF-1]|uniref:Uncharacterized protein n=1 Tax=Austropuccinia psidii MF-1 TaxID=1389203 RepID=A0A9Q3I2R4_9BASI|nr:hypothetical protein [Austropuccinia psidii MF-1]